MNLSPKQQPDLRNDRNTWSTTVASIIVGCALVSTAGAATITDNGGTAPSGNILASQLADLGPGSFDGSRNYADNGGPPGQTFTVSSACWLNSVTVKGRGDSAGDWVSGAQPFVGTEIWGIQIARVNGDGSLISLDTESATGYAAPINSTSYLTFTLATPVSLTPGQPYAFSIALTSTLGWFGLAHSTGDAYFGSTAFNNNTSTNAAQINATPPKHTFNGFVAPDPGNYDYVYALQGTVVPEPTTLALLGLGGLGLIAGYRRRHA